MWFVGLYFINMEINWMYVIMFAVLLCCHIHICYAQPNIIYIKFNLQYRQNFLNTIFI